MSNQTDGILDGFRMTELGPLPDEWEVTQLDAVVTDIAAGDWGKTKPEADLHQCCVLRGTDFYSASKGSFTDTPTRYLRASSIQKRQLRKGDVLVELSGGSRDQPTGRITLVNERMRSMSPLPVVFSNFVKRLRLSTDLCPEFFGRYWEYLYRKGVTRIYEKRTTGIRNFKLQDFLVSERMPLPPIAEQQAIARVLSTIQKTIEAQDKVIAAAREMKKSLMRHLFTYGSVPVPEAEKVPLQETEIGPVPEHWDVVALGEIADAKYGRANPKTEGDIPVVGSGGIYAKTRNALTDYPTLVIGRKGTAGEVWLCEEPCWPSDTTFYLAWKRELNIKYVFAFLSTHKLSGEHAKTTLPSLQKHELQNSFLPIAPIAEQMEIARMLSSADRKIEAEEKRKFSLQALFKSMLHSLMTGKVRVKDIGGVTA